MISHKHDDIQTVFGLRINERLFRVYLLTECAYSECEPQGGEIANAELDEKYENAWHSVAKSPRRRSGIMRDLPLSMRVPIVSPTNDDCFCRELPLFEWSGATR